jgi:LmbE family N-acetylglucosaminyl deacetylase
VAARVLVVSAHPDDETYGLGGTIQRHVQLGAVVSVLFLTDGVGARHTGVEQQKQAARRACATLGVEDVRFADKPDQRLDALPLLDLILPISEAVKELRPEVVYTHHRGDANQDHRAVFAATLVATRPFGDNPVNEVLSYEVASSTEWSAPVGDWAFLPNVFVDISETLDGKLAAVEAYRDTAAPEVRPFPHPRSCEAVRIYAQNRGVSVGMEAAEAFVLVRWLRRELSN